MKVWIGNTFAINPNRVEATTEPAVPTLKRNPEIRPASDG